MSNQYLFEKIEYPASSPGRNIPLQSQVSHLSSFRKQVGYTVLNNRPARFKYLITKAVLQFPALIG